MRAASDDSPASPEQERRRPEGVDLPARHQPEARGAESFQLQCPIHGPGIPAQQVQCALGHGRCPATALRSAAGGDACRTQPDRGQSSVARPRRPDRDNVARNGGLPGYTGAEPPVHLGVAGHQQVPARSRTRLVHRARGDRRSSRETRPETSFASTEPYDRPRMAPSPASTTVRRTGRRTGTTRTRGAPPPLMSPARTASSSAKSVGTSGGYREPRQRLNLAYTFNGGVPARSAPSLRMGTQPKDRVRYTALYAQDQWTWAG